MREVLWEDLDLEEEDDDENPFSGAILSRVEGFSPNVNDYKDFNFFVAHCNFHVTSEIVNFLCEVEGVESIDILSPYRFRISVGRLFVPQEILDHIEKKLTVTEKNEKRI